jgi:CrcB protein
MNLQTVLMVALFGALGCVARYAISVWSAALLGKAFPYGTLLVNLIGALCIGFIIEFSVKHDTFPALWRTALTTGFMGGLTTFSTFSLETVQLVLNGNYVLASLNATFNLGLSLLCVWLGVALARAI